MTKPAYACVTPEELLEWQGVEYRKTSGSGGRQLNVKSCPVCGKSDWKVYLNAETGFGNCFSGSCETKFNMWTFATALIGTSDKRAVHTAFEEIAKASGWKPERKVVIPPAPVFEGGLELPPSIPIPTPSKQNLAYLEERGFGVDIGAYFHLRYCHEGWWRDNKEDGSPSGMPFSGRVIIPVYDLDGNLVTFQGRDITGLSDTKYLFPPRLPSTGRFLYNGQNAMASKASHVVMVEGATDTWATSNALRRDTAFASITPIGSFGKHLTSSGNPDEQDQVSAFLRLRSNGLRTVTIMWDAEREALNGALHAAKMLERIGLIVRIALLPPGRDPGDAGSSVIREKIANARLFSSKLAISLRMQPPYA